MTPRSWSGPGVACAAIVCASANGARADDEPPRLGLEVAARLAYAKPVGHVSGLATDSVDGTVTDALPVWIDLGWRLSARWFLGGYGSFGPALASRAYRETLGGGTGTAGMFRVGLQAQAHVFPGARFDPWIGLGTGYEWVLLPTAGSPISLGGWEIANAQAGLDMPLSSSITWGPVVAATLGQYESWTGPRNSGDITPKAFHGWLLFGVRIAFVPRRPPPPDPDAGPDPDEVHPASP